jgi:hypothetical protein
MIDHIWDEYLHSPVHVVGYCLNPSIFYTDRFRNDAEISSGVTTCILRAAKTHYDALLVAEQMDVYSRKLGSFDSDPAVEEAAATPQGKVEGYSFLLYEPIMWPTNRWSANASSCAI